MELITWSEERFVLGIEEIDDFRREFVALVNALGDASGSAFIGLFAELLYLTRDYFEFENHLMKKSGFLARREHEIEHRQIVGELTRLQQRLQKGHIAMVRSYVRERLPHWFLMHALTMDHALVAHLRRKHPSKAGLPKKRHLQKPLRHTHTL